MQNGQLSIDLLVTLLLVIIIVSGITVIISTYASSAENLIITQQLNYGATNTASLITTAQTLSDSKFTIQLELNEINYTDERKNNKIEYPEVNIIDGNILRFSKTIKGKTYDANAQFYKTPNTNIKVDLIPDYGILVITNE